MNALYYASIINTVLRYTSPVLLATLASLLCSRAGVFNIALEGQMLLGSFFAIAVNYYTHSVVLSVLAGVAAGALVGLLVAVFQIRLGAKDMVVGTSVNILAVALSAYLLYAFFGVRGALADSSLVAMSKINLSFLPADFFLFRVFANLTFIDYGCYLIAVLLYIYMYKTIGGFHLRSVGINKAATESLGTKADRTQVCAMIVSGALCGLGGVALCMGGVTMFAENMTNGRGYVAMAAPSTLAADHPLLAILASLFFGGALAMSAVLQNTINSNITSTFPYLATIIFTSIIGLIQRYRLKNRKYKSES